MVIDSYLGWDEHREIFRRHLSLQWCHSCHFAHDQVLSNMFQLHASIFYVDGIFFSPQKTMWDGASALFLAAQNGHSRFATSAILLLMSIDISEVLECKHSFHAHFKKKSIHSFYSWCKTTNILTWLKKIWSLHQICDFFGKNWSDKVEICSQIDQNICIKN